MLIARIVGMGRSFVWIARGDLAMRLEPTDKAAGWEAWFGRGLWV